MVTVPEIVVGSPTELVELLDRFGETPDMLFRGQSAAYETLTTTLERHVFGPEDVARFQGLRHVLHDGLGADHNFLRHLPFNERHLIRQFQSRARHHLDRVPAVDETAAWLALMQHYGAPTRLLDVTRSLFVAAYFATDHSARDDGLIYVFFTPRVLLASEGNPPENKTEPSGLLAQNKDFALIWDEVKDFDDDQTAQFKLADWVIERGNLSGVLQLESRFPTRREIAQNGCFLMPLAIDASFEDQIRFTYNFLKPKTAKLPAKLSDIQLEHLADHWPLLRLRIPRDRFRAFKISLQHMGITAETLFPDFDGLAKSMHSQLRWNMEVHG